MKIKYLLCVLLVVSTILLAVAASKKFSDTKVPVTPTTVTDECDQNKEGENHD
jgi:hypothetical protein